MKLAVGDGKVSPMKFAIGDGKIPSRKSACGNVVVAARGVVFHGEPLSSVCDANLVGGIGRDFDSINGSAKGNVFAAVFVGEVG